VKRVLVAVGSLLCLTGSANAVIFGFFYRVHVTGTRGRIVLGG
jgi:hypothetical protein